MLRFFLYLILLQPCIILAMAPPPNWHEALEHALIKYAIPTEPELKSFFKKAHLTYPPQHIALLAFKRERKIELWAKQNETIWHYIHTYPLTAISGKLGPKLKEYDKQIPEGIYKLTTFNPFSSMHLSMMINYPNEFDKLHAHYDGRKNLGNNIFLHGKALSVGCLAIGDHAIDQLFLLAYRVGLNHIDLIIAPNDLRQAKPATLARLQPTWLPILYKQIKIALNAFPLSSKGLI